MQFPNFCSVLHTPHIKIRTAVPSLCFSLVDMSEAKSTEIFDTDGVTGMWAIFNTQLLLNVIYFIMIRMKQSFLNVSEPGVSDTNLEGESRGAVR